MKRIRERIHDSLRIPIAKEIVEPGKRKSGHARLPVTRHLLMSGAPPIQKPAPPAQSHALFSSIPLDDKNGLIVNTIFLANLSQTIVSFESVFEQCIADVFWRQLVMLAHDVFKLLSFLRAASVVNPVGVK
jgi:hypothetical protein